MATEGDKNTATAIGYNTYAAAAVGDNNTATAIGDGAVADAQGGNITVVDKPGRP